MPSTTAPPHRRAVAGLLIAATLLILLPACQRGTVGKRCNTKDFGDDGGSWVLVCRNGRWARALTKADAARILFPPTTAAPTTTTLPPLLSFRKSFGAGTHTAGTTMPNDLMNGLYSTVEPAGQSCAASTQVSVSLGQGPVKVLSVASTAGTIVNASGPCTWTLLESIDDTAGGMVLTTPSSVLEFPGGPSCRLDSLASLTAPHGDSWSVAGTFGPVIATISRFGPIWGYGGIASTTLPPRAVLASNCGIPRSIALGTSGVVMSDPVVSGGRVGYWSATSQTIGFTGGVGTATVTFGGYTLEISDVQPWTPSIGLRLSGCNASVLHPYMFGSVDTAPGTGVIIGVRQLSAQIPCDDGSFRELGLTLP
ncbi:MAG: hypothetical protein U0Q22_03485 [Acidimicrobiales bacterium]